VRKEVPFLRKRRFLRTFGFKMGPKMYTVGTKAPKPYLFAHKRPCQKRSKTPKMWVLYTVDPVFRGFVRTLAEMAICAGPWKCTQLPQNVRFLAFFGGFCAKNANLRAFCLFLAFLCQLCTKHPIFGFLSFRWYLPMGFHALALYVRARAPLVTLAYSTLTNDDPA